MALANLLLAVVHLKRNTGVGASLEALALVEEEVVGASETGISGAALVAGVDTCLARPGELRDVSRGRTLVHADAEHRVVVGQSRVR